VIREPAREKMMHEEVIMDGTGGQGIMIMGQLLARAAMMEGRHVVWFPSYGPEARGGTADCTVIISADEIGSPISAHPDTLIGMHQFLFSRYQPIVRPGGMLVVNTSLVDMSSVRADCRVVEVAANTIAEELGIARAANMVILGAYVASTGAVSVDSILASMPEVLPPHNHRFIPLNEKALRRGAELVEG
jgi:2-oxoglutarate ferredoxin oxidoreductase subunit gamma